MQSAFDKIENLPSISVGCSQSVVYMHVEPNIIRYDTNHSIVSKVGLCTRVRGIEAEQQL